MPEEDTEEDSLRGKVVKALKLEGEHVLRRGRIPAGLLPLLRVAVADRAALLAAIEGRWDALQVLCLPPPPLLLCIGTSSHFFENFRKFPASQAELGL